MKESLIWSYFVRVPYLIIDFRHIKLSILFTILCLIEAIILFLEHQEALKAVERREEQEAEERAEAHELDLFRLKDEYLARTLNLRTRIETLEQQLEKYVVSFVTVLIK